MAYDRCKPWVEHVYAQTAPYNPFKGVTHLVTANGEYDEVATEQRTNNANAKITRSEVYEANTKRREIEKRLEQRALALDIAEYH